MALFDITIPLSTSLPAYPGDPPFSLEPLSGGGSVSEPSVSRLTMTTHSGTHLDVPRHIKGDGSTVDDIPLSLLMGPALVVDLSGAREIDGNTLRQLNLGGVERLLLKTANSSLWQYADFVEEFAALSVDGASHLLETGVRLVGIDYLSIEAAAGNGRVHELLLSSGIVILEGLDLSSVPAGTYELIALPLPIRGGDGAPVRAVLRDNIIHRDGASVPETGRQTS